MTISASEHGDWYTLSETSKILGVHPATIRQWSDEGKLPVFRTPGGHRRFARVDIDRLLQVSPVRGAGLSAVETVEVFLYFRFPVVRAVMGLIEEEEPAARRAARLFIEIGQFMDQVLVATVHAHERPQSPAPRESQPRRTPALAGA